ncbi:MAG: hypothetical protein Kow00124_27590 [Anaerolineae bacterium]
MDHFIPPTARVLVGILQGRRPFYRYYSTRHTGEVALNRPGLLLACAVLLTLLIASPSRGWLVPFSGLLTLLGGSGLAAVLSARQVSFSRRLLHEWVQVGDQIEETFTIDNRFSLPLLAVEVRDDSSIPGYNASTVRSVGERARCSWRQTGVGERRGLFRLGPTTLTFGDPLGLFRVTCTYPDVQEVLIFPPVLFDMATHPPTGAGQGAAVSRQRSRIETAAIGGVRDYVPGDPIRRIHWPLSVRHQSFLVKEFDREMGSDTWLLLDLDPSVQSGEGARSTVEAGVVLAATWAWHLLHSGRRVGLFTYGPGRVLLPPGEGREHLWAILRALAPLQAAGEASLNDLLRQIRPRLRRGQSLVVITPSTHPNWLAELGRTATAVVLLDRVEDRTEPTTTSPVDAIRALLIGMGIPVYLVQGETIRAARSVGPRSRPELITTPWGRVVVRQRAGRAPL